MDKEWLLVPFGLLFLIFSFGCIGELPGETELANPSAVYCEELGYDYEIQTMEDGNQYGVCRFPDGSACGGWQFYRGECGKAFSYCTSQGHELHFREEVREGQRAVYAVCVFQDGSECGEHEYFAGECEQGQCSRWFVLKGGCTR